MKYTRIRIDTMVDFTMDSNIHTPVSTNAPTQADNLPTEFPVSLDGIDKLKNAEQVTS